MYNRIYKLEEKMQQQNQEIGCFVLILWILFFVIVSVMPDSAEEMFSIQRLSPLTIRQNTNLLLNPSFEGNYPIQNGIPEITVAEN